MNLRPYIRGALWAGGLLMAVLFVAGILWLVLLTVGDEAGSQGAKGVTLVAAGCLVLDVLVLIVLLAVTEITRAERDRADQSPPT